MKLTRDWVGIGIGMASIMQGRHTICCLQTGICWRLVFDFGLGASIGIGPGLDGLVQDVFLLHLRKECGYICICVMIGVGCLFACINRVDGNS